MSNLTSDELHHAGRKGMKWGMHIFGRRQTQGGARGKRGAKPEQQNAKMPKKPRRSVDERLREAEFRDAYRTRDNMSTKALKSKIARLEAEQRFKQLVEAPEKARLEALQKKKQARLAFIGKVGSAALDVYSKAPSSIAGRNLSGQAAKDAVEAFKKRQEWAKAFKDVPTTMTKFTQSINVGGVDVYIPESVQNRFMIQHAGRKGMKWGMNIFGKRDRYAKIHRLTKDLYDSQPTEQNRLLTNVAYDARKDARKDAKATRKKYKRSVKKIFNKYSETDFDLKGGLAQSGVNMGETINGVYIPSQDDLLLHYGKKGMKWKKKGEGAIGVGTVGAAPAFQDKALERRAAIERLIAQEHDKAANKTNNPKKKEIRKELREKAKKNSKDLEKKREDMYNPYRGDKLPKKKVKHSDISEDTLLHYGKKGMKWKKNAAGSAPMTPAEMAILDARTKKEEKSYSYNKKMREKAIENALRRGASGKEIRKLQDRLADDNRKVVMNKDHKAALKKKDFKRSSYERSYTEIDASNGNKPKIKKYKY